VPDLAPRVAAVAEAICKVMAWERHVGVPQCSHMLSISYKGTMNLLGCFPIKEIILWRLTDSQASKKAESSYSGQRTCRRNDRNGIVICRRALAISCSRNSDVPSAMGSRPAKCLRGWSSMVQAADNRNGLTPSGAANSLWDIFSDRACKCARSKCHLMVALPRFLPLSPSFPMCATKIRGTRPHGA
jgi:hypothetical protein